MTLKEFIKLQIKALDANGIVNADFVIALDNTGEVVSNSTNTVSFSIGRKFLPENPPSTVTDPIPVQPKPVQV